MYHMNNKLNVGDCYSNGGSCLADIWLSYLQRGRSASSSFLYLTLERFVLINYFSFSMAYDNRSSMTP
jgi:hypothetical protein